MKFMAEVHFVLMVEGEVPDDMSDHEQRKRAMRIVDKQIGEQQIPLESGIEWASTDYLKEYGEDEDMDTWFDVG